MTASVRPDEAAALRAGEAAWPGIIAAARRDPAVFAAMVLRDEATAQRVHMDPPHVDMQDGMTRHTRCLYTAPQRSGKSQQLYARIIWELGHNHTHRVLVACNTHQNASKALQLIGRLIKGSDDVHAVFPDLLPSTPWGETQLTIKRRGWIRDPSVRAVGVGTEITGGRVTWCLLDDTITPENTATSDGRQKTVDWYHENVLGRLDPGTHVVGVANCLHADDMFHRFAKTSVWHCRSYPVLTDDGALAFPHRWTRGAIAERKAEYDASSPLDYERFMLCRTSDDQEALFRREFLDLGMVKGNGHQLLESLPNIPAGCTTWTGYDVAVSLKETSDLRALVTLLRMPHGELLPLQVESGRWDFREQILRLVSAHQRFGSTLVVESVAAQRFLVSQLQYEFPDIPVRCFNTTAQSKALGLHQVAADLAGGRFALPNLDGKMAPEVEELVSEMRNFRPEAHTGDRLMAAMIAASYSRRMMMDVPEIRWE